MNSKGDEWQGQDKHEHTEYIELQRVYISLLWKNRNFPKMENRVFFF